MRKLNIFCLVAILLISLTGCDKSLETKPIENSKVIIEPKEAIVSDEMHDASDEQRLDDDTILHFQNGEKVDITPFIIKEESYAIPDWYLKDTYWTGDEMLDKVLMIEIIRTASEIVTFKKEIVNAYLIEDDILKLESPMNLSEWRKRWYDNVVYDMHAFKPYYSEYDDYIVVEKISSYKEVVGYTQEEAYIEYEVTPDWCNVDCNYYYVDKNNECKYEDRGYYMRLYENEAKTEMIEGEFINLNRYLDLSYNDEWYRGLNEGGTSLGMTRWTGDNELDRALLAYILDVYSHDSRLREDYLMEFVNEEDAQDIITRIRKIQPPNGNTDPVNGIQIERYLSDCTFLVNVSMETSYLLGAEDYKNDPYTKGFIVKQPDGKYKIYANFQEEEFLEHLENLK